MSLGSSSGAAQDDGTATTKLTMGHPASPSGVILPNKSAAATAFSAHLQLPQGSDMDINRPRSGTGSRDLSLTTVVNPSDITQGNIAEVPVPRPWYHPLLDCVFMTSTIQQTLTSITGLSPSITQTNPSATPFDPTAHTQQSVAMPSSCTAGPSAPHQQLAITNKQYSQIDVHRALPVQISLSPPLLSPHQAQEHLRFRNNWTRHAPMSSHSLQPSPHLPHLPHLLALGNNNRVCVRPTCLDKKFPRCLGR